MIIKTDNISDIELEIYKNLKELDFIPKYSNGELSYRDGKKSGIMTKENLVSLAEALALIKKKGYRHNNLKRENILFDEKGHVSSIIGWEKADKGRALDDFIYAIANYVDMADEFYSNDYAIDLIISMVEVYDSFTDDVDLSYELYWYQITALTKYDKESPEFKRTLQSLDFIRYYKPELDSTHIEDI